MPLSTDYKRALLRTLHDECADTGLTLLEGIQALRKARVQTTYSGSVVISTAANGHAITLDANKCTPQEIAAVASQLEDAYATSKTALIAAGTAVPTDAQMRDQMLLHPAFVGYRSLRPDFSEYPAAYGS